MRVLYQGYLIVVMAALLIAPAAGRQGDQTTSEPDQLEYYQGHAYMGGESVKWEEGRLVFLGRFADLSGKGSVRETVEKLDPRPEAWKRFWERIDSLGVWQWKPDYHDPNRSVPDGESWSVALRHGANKVKSQGYNAVPEGYSEFHDAVYKLMEEAGHHPRETK